MADLVQLIAQLGTQARAAARTLAGTPPARLDAALEAMATELLAGKWTFSMPTPRCVRRQGRGPDRRAGRPADARFGTRRGVRAGGLRKVASLPHPVGQVVREWTQPNGLRFAKVRVPLGVIGFIYESRPTSPATPPALCQSGNASSCAAVPRRCVRTSRSPRPSAAASPRPVCRGGGADGAR